MAMQPSFPASKNNTHGVNLSNDMDLRQMESVDSSAAMDEPFIKTALDELLIKFMEKMVIEEQFLAVLLAENVINFVEKQEIEALKSNIKEINKVHEHIRRNIRGRYDGFLKALTETNQEHIVELLQEKITLIKTAQTAGVSAQVSRGVKRKRSWDDDQRTQYKCWEKSILKGGHVTSKEPDKRIDLDTQFIKLSLITGKDRYEINNFSPQRYQHYIQQEVGRENIDIESLLTRVMYESKENVRIKCPLLLEGRGGVGKSTLLQKMMHLWVQNKWAKDYKAAFLINMRLTVVDKRRFTLVEFLKFCGVYILDDVRDDFIKSVVKNEEDKILVFIDGLDEIPDLAEKLLQHEKNHVERAEPFTWCLDILCRDVLGESVLILASRPFRDLAALHCNPMLEVVGLTEEAIQKFIDCHVGQNCKTEEEKIATVARVKTRMTGNKLVMSVSSITYFCMLFCQVLEEDQNVSLTGLTTYTRLSAFFIQRYLSRCPTQLSVHHTSPTSCLPPLARLAYRGLVEKRVNDLPRLVFDGEDHKAVQLMDSDEAFAVDCGILKTKGAPGPRSKGQIMPNITSEFVHLSVQELLAMLELLQKDTDTIEEMAFKMWMSTSFNMAKMFLYGIKFDINSPHISNLLKDLPTNLAAKLDTSEETENILFYVMKNLILSGGLDISQHNNTGPDIESQHHYSQEETEGGDGDDRADHNESVYYPFQTKLSQRHYSDQLQIMQVVYETQRRDIARDIGMKLFESVEMTIENTLLTLIDINALLFMMNQVENIQRLSFSHVTMDGPCIETFCKGLSVNITHLVLPGMNQKAAQGAVVALKDKTQLEILLFTLLDSDENENLENEIMEQLLSNYTLKLVIWCHKNCEYSLVCVPDTVRRVSVTSDSSDIYNIKAWTPSDIATSSPLSHLGVRHRNNKLRLYLNDQFSSIYSERHPSVSPDVWSQLLQDATHSELPMRMLELRLPSSFPLTSLLTTITSNLEALVDTGLMKVAVFQDEFTQGDMNAWYATLNTPPGWSVESFYSGYVRTEFTIVTSTHNQSPVTYNQSWIISFRRTRISSPPSASQVLLQENTGKVLILIIENKMTD